MVDFAKEIVVTRGGGLTIDGKDFPWMVMDGMEVSVAKGQMQTLTVSIPAERILVTDTQGEIQDRIEMQRCAPRRAKRD